MRKWLIAASLLFASMTSGVEPADARVEHSLRYTKKQSYNGALRFLRVASGFTILEKDMDSGYLLFEYPTGSDTEVTHGSIEVIERKSSVALVIQLPKMPSHHERMLATDLLKKLRTDYGAPPDAKRPKKDSPKEKPKAPDAEEKKPLPSPPIQRAP